MAGAEDVAEVGLVLEGVGVLRRVALEADLDGGLAADAVGLAEEGRILGVERAGAVALLALDRLEVLVLDHLGAAGAAEGGDMAADAAQVVVLVVVDEGLVGLRVAGGLPEGDGLLVTGLALLHADVGGLARGRRRRRDAGEALHVLLGDPGVVAAEGRGGGGVDREPAGDLHLIKGGSGRVRGRVGGGERAAQGGGLVFEAAEEGGIGGGIVLELGEATLDAGELGLAGLSRRDQRPLRGAGRAAWMRLAVDREAEMGDGLGLLAGLDDPCVADAGGGAADAPALGAGDVADGDDVDAGHCAGDLLGQRSLALDEDDHEVCAGRSQRRDLAGEGGDRGLEGGEAVGAAKAGIDDCGDADRADVELHEAMAREAERVALAGVGEDTGEGPVGSGGGRLGRGEVGRADPGDEAISEGREALLEERRSLCGLRPGGLVPRGLGAFRVGKEEGARLDHQAPGGGRVRLDVAEGVAEAAERLGRAAAGGDGPEHPPEDEEIEGGASGRRRAGLGLAPRGGIEAAAAAGREEGRGDRKGEPAIGVGAAEEVRRASHAGHVGDLAVLASTDVGDRRRGGRGREDARALRGPSSPGRGLARMP